MLSNCYMREIYVVDLDFYNYNKVHYNLHKVRDINYWLLGRGSLYSYPMLAKSRNNTQLAIL